MGVKDITVGGVMATLGVMTLVVTLYLIDLLLWYMKWGGTALAEALTLVDFLFMIFLIMTFGGTTVFLIIRGYNKFKGGMKDGT